MLSKKEIKIVGRKEYLIRLATSQKVYCYYHSRFLSISDIENYHCYDGCHGTRYCNYVEFPDGNREGQRRREEMMRNGVLKIREGPVFEKT
jgi:hypothetical protein